MKTDCLIIGFNDSNFVDYVEMVRSMGEDSGAFRDLDLAIIDYEGRPRRSMDMLNLFHFGREDPPKPFNNTDFLWPTILYLGTFLSRRGLTFDYVNQFHLQKDELREKLLHEDILTVGITTTLYVAPHPILEIISFIREHNARVKIVVGGPFVANQAKVLEPDRLEQLLKFMGADYYVISDEGEQTMVDLLQALKAGAGLDRIDNLAYREGGRYMRTASSVERNALEENMIDYSLFPRQDIGEFVSLRTAKSCPFSCAFCGFPQRAGKYTYLSVDLVEQELNWLCDLGVRTLTFLDDTFNVPKPRFKQLLEMMIRNKYGFKWNSFYRSDHGTEETVELMARAGCEGVFLGVESGSDEMLKRMNKTSRRHNYMQAIPWLRDRGISTHANFIVGFPGETYDTVLESISMVEEARPDFHRAQLWYCDPVTPIWNQREQYGVEGSSFSWSHDTMDYRLACDLVDRIFLCMENSVWLPQYGFEQWSTFYLQRKGMELDRIKTFVKFFNMAVREKLIHGRDTPVGPEFVEGMRRSARFDTEEAPDSAHLEKQYSGAGYVEAESYWIRELGNGHAASALDSVTDGVRGTEEARRAVAFTIARETVERLREIPETELAQVTLAAFSLLLARLSGREEAVIVTAMGENGSSHALPLRLSPSWGSSFRSFVHEVGSKLEEARPHAMHAFGVLTNPWRLAPHAGECPVFEAGYRFRVSLPGREEEVGFPGRLPEEIECGLAMVLEATQVGDDLSARILYSPAAFGREIMERVASTYDGILAEVAEDPELRLGDVQIDAAESHLAAVIAADADELFNF